MKSPLDTLLARLAERRLRDAGVIPWSSPVPVFGDLRHSYVATLGLNPSNREFVDSKGKELNGPLRRFETLNSLGLRTWKDATARHVVKILASYKNYFASNPYDTWFKKLDAIISETRASYYCGTASHLDLVAYATSCKWGNLTSRQRHALVLASGCTMAWLVRESPVRLLILNGSSVVSLFQESFGVQLQKTLIPSWSLRAGGDKSVAGYAYAGQVRTLGKISLERDIRVLGFNHNIQSSFGVTREVTASIRRWIGFMSEDVHGKT